LFAKFGNPVYLQELDWAVTISKYEFPWRDIAEGITFSSRQCHEKYVSMVRDAHSFLKKVLNGGQGAGKEKYLKLMQNQLDEPSRFKLYQQEEAEEVFCVCKGANPSGFFVACEAETDCPYNGWLHPECTDELKNKSQTFIDNMGPWYCQACALRMNAEEASEND
jgi:hypothetical protein